MTAISLAGGRERSYHQNASAQREENESEGGQLPAHERTPREPRVAALAALAGAAAGPRPAPGAGAPRRRRGSGPSRSRNSGRRRAPPRSARRRSRGRRPAERPRSANSAANSASCVARTTAPPRRARRSQCASRALGRRVHAPRGLIECEHARRARRRRGQSRGPGAGAARPRGPAGCVRRAPPAPPCSSASARGLLLDALVQEVVAGVLQQQRHPARIVTVPRVGSSSPGGVAQQRRLAGSVAAHQHDGLPGPDAQVDARAGSSGRRCISCQTPLSSRAAALRLPSAQAAPQSARARRAAGVADTASRRTSSVASSSPCAPQRGARLLDAGGRRAQIPRVANIRAPGVCSAGLVLGRPIPGSHADRGRRRSDRPTARSPCRLPPGTAPGDARSAGRRCRPPG